MSLFALFEDVSCETKTETKTKRKPREKKTVKQETNTSDSKAKSKQKSIRNKSTDKLANKINKTKYSSEITEDKSVKTNSNESAIEKSKDVKTKQLKPRMTGWLKLSKNEPQSNRPCYFYIGDDNNYCYGFFHNKDIICDNPYKLSIQHKCLGDIYYKYANSKCSDCSDCPNSFPSCSICKKNK